MEHIVCVLRAVAEVARWRVAAYHISVVLAAPHRARVLPDKLREASSARIGSGPWVVEVVARGVEFLVPCLGDLSTGAVARARGEVQAFALVRSVSLRRGGESGTKASKLICICLSGRRELDIKSECFHTMQVSLDIMCFPLR